MKNFMDTTNIIKSESNELTNAIISLNENISNSLNMLKIPVLTMMIGIGIGCAFIGIGIGSVLMKKTNETLYIQQPSSKYDEK